MRRAIDMLVVVALVATVADVVVGAAVAEGTETGAVVVTASVCDGATPVDVVGCVGSGPSCTVRDAVFAGAAPPAPTVAHAVVLRITASMAHTRRPVIPARIRPASSETPPPGHDEDRQEALKFPAMMPKVLSTLPVADASSTEK
ncbi:MAG: hypothetical protein ACXWBO_06015 [Ilumatobacteraceae bacterium]